MKNMAAIAVLVAVLIPIVPAEAHMLRHVRPLSKMTPAQEYRYGSSSARHSRLAVRRYGLAVRWFAVQPNRPTQLDTYAHFAWQSAFAHARAMLRGHRWLLRASLRIRAQGWKRLHPAPQLPWAFWDCVATGRLHGVTVSVGEGGATSYNPAGPWFGRYQMDWGFMRNHGADMLRKYGGRDARSWSVLDQTIVAERGYHVQGPGAWPNTAPPCLSLR